MSKITASTNWADYVNKYNRQPAQEMGEAFKELIDILEKNYYIHNPQFLQELLTALKQKTGNNNIGKICTYIIGNLEN